MIEGFKSWISAILCTGIFISILELILPKTKMKKYIYVLVGIITTITIISPGIDLLNNKDIAKSVSSVIENFSGNVNINNEDKIEEYKKNQEENVKKEFLNSLENDIKNKLAFKDVAVNDIYILLAENYDIQKIQVKIKKLKNSSFLTVNELIEYINNEYDIAYSKIEVIESGE
ncbi:MAG: stage III sporulation protein AF [Clostridia bacterium]